MVKGIYKAAPDSTEPVEIDGKDFKLFYTTSMVRAKLITLGEFYETYLGKKAEEGTEHYRGYLWNTIRTLC